MSVWVVSVDENGRLQLPPDVWDALQAGQDVQLHVEMRDGRLTLRRLADVTPEKNRAGVREAREASVPYRVPEHDTHTVRLTVTLTADVYRLLLEEAKVRRRPPEEVVADIVSSSLEWQRTLANDPVRNLFGSIESGEPDISERVDDIVYNR